MSDRLALIIANSEFDDPKLSRLRTPSRDAEALAQVLSDPAIGGFEVSLLVDEREPVVRRRIARLYYRRKRGDLLLLYYSGHGIKDKYGGELYLATRDTEMDIASATALSAATGALEPGGREPHRARRSRRCIRRFPANRARQTIPRAPTPGRHQEARTQARRPHHHLPHPPRTHPRPGREIPHGQRPGEG
jgi:uncharacterized caspase-like protein